MAGGVGDIMLGKWYSGGNTEIFIFLILLPVIHRIRRDTVGISRIINRNTVEPRNKLDVQGKI